MSLMFTDISFTLIIFFIYSMFATGSYSLEGVGSLFPGSSAPSSRITVSDAIDAAS